MMRFLAVEPTEDNIRYLGSVRENIASVAVHFSNRGIIYGDSIRLVLGTPLFVGIYVSGHGEVREPLANVTGLQVRL